MALSLSECMFWECLQFLPIEEYNWMLNLLEPEVGKRFWKKWSMDNKFKITTSETRREYYFNGSLLKRISYFSNCNINEWFSRGLPHRVGHPAWMSIDTRGPNYVENKEADYNGGLGEVWFLNGKLHRKDGPASIFGRDQYWCINGKPHRVDGPATIRDDDQEWWVEGKRHRDDGPAVIKRRRFKWYHHGVRFTPERRNEDISEVVGWFN